jgi:hypothetical protein
MPTPDYIAADEKELKVFQNVIVKPVRLRVFNVLKKWIDEHWYDFEGQPELVESVKKFVDTTMMASMENAAQNLQKLIARKVSRIFWCDVYLYRHRSRDKECKSSLLRQHVLQSSSQRQNRSVARLLWPCSTFILQKLQGKWACCIRFYWSSIADSIGDSIAPLKPLMIISGFNGAIEPPIESRMISIETNGILDS